MASFRGGTSRIWQVSKKTVELVLKKWLNEGETPRDFYELIDCRRLETRREILMDAIETANEFFFKCQEHGSATARKRAREFQRRLAEARQIICHRERWRQYDEKVIEQIHSDLEKLAANQGMPDEDRLKDWLADVQLVAGPRIDEVFDEMKARIPREVELAEIPEVEFKELPTDAEDDEPIILSSDASDKPSSGDSEEPVILVNENSGVLDRETVAKISRTQPDHAPHRRPEGLKRKFAIVGIDLGTTFSAIAYVDDHGKAQVVGNPEDQQRPIMPSAVFFEEGEALIGQSALENAYVEPECVVQFAKRSLGERTTYQVGGQSLTPESISALILKKMIHFATPAIGPIERAVITVPAFFNEKRRAATVQCGEIAGLQVEATLNEPSAALIAYGLHNDPELEHPGPEGKPLVKNYVVYDLGGGTFDVTVMAVSKNRVKELATGGNRELGGMDWDHALMEFVASEFEAEYASNPKETPESMQALLAACTAAKIQLSTRKRTVVTCTHAGRAHRVEVTRDKFEELTAAMLAMTELTVETCLRDAGLDWDQVEDVLMVGGSTMMPMVQQMLERIAGKKPRTDIDPSTVVAQGAAVYAGVLETEGNIRGAGEHQGAQAPEGKAPQASNRKSPNEKTSTMLPSPAGFVIEQLGSRDEMDDLEIFASETRGSNVDLQLVNSHGVGVYASRKGRPINVVMIPRNSELPTSQRQMFRTTRDGLRELRVRVSEGDSTERGSCDLLGTCVLGPLPRGLPRGTPVELRIGFDKDGRIQVSADCKGTRIGAEIEARALLSEVQMKEERRKVDQLIASP